MTENNEHQNLIESLIQKGQKEYKLLEILDDPALSKIETGGKGEEPDREEIRWALIDIIELSIFENMNPGDALLQCAKGLLGMKTESVAVLFKTWAACVKSAQPYRKSMTSTLTGFHETMAGALPDNEEFMEFLPVLYSHMGPYSEGFIPAIAKILREEVPEKLHHDYLEFLKTYMPYIFHKSFKGLIYLGSFFYLGQCDLSCCFEKFEEPQELEDDMKAQKYLHKTGLLLESCPPSFKAPYVRICTDIAAHSFSSAAYVASKLKGITEKLPEQMRERYVTALEEIIGNVGVAAVSFCLKKLPSIVSTRKAEEMSKNLKDIATVANDYGPNAAFEYLMKVS